jgi:hypothetical protein
MITGSQPSAEHDRKRIHERAISVHLQGKVKAATLSVGKKGGQPSDVDRGFRDAWKAGEREQLVNIMTEASRQRSRGLEAQEGDMVLR